MTLCIVLAQPVLELQKKKTDLFSPSSEFSVVATDARATLATGYWLAAIRSKYTLGSKEGDKYNNSSISFPPTGPRSIFILLFVSHYVHLSAIAIPTISLQVLKMNLTDSLDCGIFGQINSRLFSFTFVVGSCHRENTTGYRTTFNSAFHIIVRD